MQAYHQYGVGSRPALQNYKKGVLDSIIYITFKKYFWFSSFDLKRTW
jgi:hypothetical protein